MLTQLNNYKFSMIPDYHKSALSEQKSKAFKNIYYVKYNGDVILALGDDTISQDMHTVAYWLENDNQITNRLTSIAKEMYDCEQPS
jgi:hypothetical protein